MADNVILPGSGASIASDEIAGAQYQRVKMTLGADGVNDGDVSASNPLPVSLASITRAEDTPGASGDQGLVILAQRRDADSGAASADGDYVTFKMDEAGRLKVSAAPANQPAVSGNITANGQTVFMDTSRTSNITIHCTGTFSTINVAFEGSLNSTNGTDGNWFGVQAVRTNANTIETTTGNLSAAPVYGWELSVNGLNWFRVRATAFTSGTQAWRFQPAPYATEPVPAIQAHPVTGSGNFNTAAQAGTNLMGDVGIQVRGNATGAASIHHIVSAATTNAAIVKAGGGRVFGFSLANTTSAWQYVKLHNIATAPTAGAGVVMTIGIPPNGKAQQSIPAGIGFATGIGRTIVTGAADADATATTAASVVGDIFFA